MSLVLTGFLIESYIYVAAAMANELKKIVTTGVIDSNKIPKNLLQDSIKIFDLAEESTHDGKIPHNPVDSAAAYAILAKIIRQQEGLNDFVGRKRPLGSRAKINQLIQIYTKDLKMLKSGELDGQDPASRFFEKIIPIFEKIVELGQQTVYEKSCRCIDDE